MNYLEKLCEDLEISPELEKTDAGGKVFPLTDSLHLEVRELSVSGFFFYSPIADLPKESPENLMIYLMKANLFGQGTLGASIGLSEESGLTLSHSLPYDMDYQSFKESLEDFANIVDYWRDEIGRFKHQAKSGIL